MRNLQELVGVTIKSVENFTFNQIIFTFEQGDGITIEAFHATNSGLPELEVNWMDANTPSSTKMSGDASPEK